ncbi:carbohydrate kinase [Flavobacterium sp. SUN052]|uniref:carbohydrate kinase family protein n=1 Tax=Flavobacterium sp. SUN052 TaxID=3002441 RepID=UPI00237D359A|nr:carbohydrate kinase [Flavobacterium sp. SUN052]MEC4005102.1 carbohydrate kinase [Flavobacterium sp. SUN052]
MNKKIVCFGEVLWDVLPTEKIAGGAPMNVSIRLQSLGIETKMISKIGKDSLGNALLEIIKNKNVATSLIQIDEKLSTGEVLVHLNENGSATYDIVYPSAWDKIELNDENKKAVQEADALVYGSLACRDEVSRSTLLSLLKLAKYKIFDVNLRPPFYSISFLKEMMDLADFVKLNDEELLEITQALGSKTDSIHDNILFLSELTNTKTICVTKGKDGAVLYSNNQFYSNNGIEVKVADTIGAGDSFLAALLSKVLYTNDYSYAVEFGCIVGALVASHKGANPEISADAINLFLKSKVS